MKGENSMCLFTGACVALATPFKADGSVDFDAFAQMLEFQIVNHTDAILVCGTTGEPSTMTRDEQKRVIAFALEKVNGRVPVIASTGGNNTAEVIEKSKDAQALGADGLLVVTPYYNKTTQAGLIAHYTAVADAMDLPIIVYNVPGRTGLNMTAETLAALSYHKNIVGMKEASGNMAQVSDMIRLCQGRIAMYSGEDGLVVPLMSLGGKGVISVVSNIAPQDMHDLAAAALSGDYKTACDLQFKIAPLVKWLFSEVNPIPVKAALAAMGQCQNVVRLPLVPMGEENKVHLIEAMRAYGFSV